MSFSICLSVERVVLLSTMLYKDSLTVEKYVLNILGNTGFPCWALLFVTRRGYVGWTMAETL